MSHRSLPDQTFGLDSESIRFPVDAWGVCSQFVRGESYDDTADIVAVKIHDDWASLARDRRRLIGSETLETVDL